MRHAAEEIGIPPHACPLQARCARFRRVAAILSRRPASRIAIRDAGARSAHRTTRRAQSRTIDVISNSSGESTPTMRQPISQTPAAATQPRKPSPRNARTRKTSRARMKVISMAHPRTGYVDYAPAAAVIGSSIIRDDERQARDRLQLAAALHGHAAGGVRRAHPADQLRPLRRAVSPQWHGVEVLGRDRPMPNATADGITLINFGMGSPNAATVMDLLSRDRAEGRAVPGQVRRPQEEERNRRPGAADRGDPRRRHLQRLPAAGGARAAGVPAAARVCRR